MVTKLVGASINLETSVAAPTKLPPLTATVSGNMLKASSQGLAFDSSGNLYVADYSSNTVNEVTPSGIVSTFVLASAGLSDPSGLAFDSSGNLYVANLGDNTISEVTPLGIVSTFVPASAGLSWPEGLAFDRNGNLYVVNGNDNNTVSEVTPSGVVSTFLPASAGLSDPTGLAFDSSGNLYVTNVGNDTVSEVSPSGKVSTFVPTSAGLSWPFGLAFDNSGNLYVANHRSDTVSEVSPNGTVSTFVPASAGLSGPMALAFDSSNNLYVAGFSLVSKVVPLSSFAVSAADAYKLSAIGLTLNADGAFSGTVTSLPSVDPLTFTVIATNALGDSGSVVVNLMVTQPVISPAVLKTNVGATPGLPALTVMGLGNTLTNGGIWGGGSSELDAVAFDSMGNLYLADAGHIESVLN